MDEATILGGRWDKVVLAGISMGAATGLHVLFNLDVPVPSETRESGVGRRRGLGAFMGFSCRCPFAGRSSSLAEMRRVLGLDGVPNHADVICNTPVLLEHCVDDPVVLVQYNRDLENMLERFGARVERKEYQTGGHAFNQPDGVDDVVEFMKKIITGV